MMKYVVLVLIMVFIIPVSLNFYHGYLKPACDDKVSMVNCQNLSNNLEPHIDEITHVMEQHGTALKTKYNFHSSEGFKMVRADVKSLLPHVFEIIEDHAKRLKIQGLEMSNCDVEKYCWFLRLYNREGHFLDWHFDNNFSSGSRYTYVCNLHTSANNESQFLTLNKNNRIHVIPNVTGQGVFYNGSEVKHAISRQNANATRIALVIPFYENHTPTLIGAWRKWARGIIYSTLKL